MPGNFAEFLDVSRKTAAGRKIFSPRGFIPLIKYLTVPLFKSPERLEREQGVKGEQRRNKTQSEHGAHCRYIVKA